MAPEEFYIVGTDINKWHLELPDLDKRYIVPRCNTGNYIDSLNKIIARENIEFVHPQPDSEVSILSENRTKIRAKMLLPKKRTIRICQNKSELINLLANNNVHVPRSILIDKEENLYLAISSLNNASNKIWLRAIKGAGAKASLPIINKTQGAMWIDYWKEMKGIGYGDFMACEFLPGREFAFQSIWRDGELLTSAARERIEYVFQELSISGQTSSPSVAKVVHLDNVNEVATKAILSVDKNANGIFCVDLKENADNIPCVMEINAGRFFTTSNFFATIGANMPYTYVRLAYGEELPILEKYNAAPVGYYWIRLIDKGPILIREGTWKSEII